MKIYDFQVFTDGEVTLHKREILHRTYVMKFSLNIDVAYDTADKHVVHMQVSQLPQFFLFQRFAERFASQYLRTFPLNDICR